MQKLKADKVAFLRVIVYLKLILNVSHTQSINHNPNNKILGRAFRCHYKAHPKLTLLLAFTS